MKDFHRAGHLRYCLTSEYLVPQNKGLDLINSNMGTNIGTNIQLSSQLLDICAAIHLGFNTS